MQFKIWLIRDKNKHFYLQYTNLTSSWYIKTKEMSLAHFEHSHLKVIHKNKWSNLSFQLCMQHKEKIMYLVYWLHYCLDDHGLNTSSSSRLFLFQSIQTSSGVYPASYLVSIMGCFPLSKVGGALGWLLTATYCQVLRLCGTIPPLPPHACLHSVDRDIFNLCLYQNSSDV
jgi:hypothetical protein